jgi:hypothetical protein
MPRREKDDTPPFFGGLPRHGVWTTVHLSAGQFAAILALSLALFVFLDGPLWQHLRDSHTLRILASYAAIPAAVALALARNGRLRPMPLLGGTLVIGVIKLLLTAFLVMVLGLLPR